MNEVVKFPINTPVEVTLQCETGKRVDGRYGEQVMYSLWTIASCTCHRTSNSDSRSWLLGPASPCCSASRK